MARIRQAQGDLAGALELLDEAQRVYMGDFSPNVRPVPAMTARAAGRAGPGRRGARLGARAGPVRRRRRCPTCASSSTSPWPGCCWRGTRPPHRNLRRRGGPAPGAAAGGRGGGRADRQRHRDPGAAGARPARPRRYPGRPRPAGTRADPGRAGGLRPRVRGRGTTDGRPATSGRETAAWGYVRRLAGRLRPAGGDRPAPGPRGAAQRARAGGAPAARHRPGRPGHRAASSWCR